MSSDPDLARRRIVAIMADFEFVFSSPYGWLLVAVALVVPLVLCWWEGCCGQRFGPRRLVKSVNHRLISEALKDPALSDAMSTFLSDVLQKTAESRACKEAAVGLFMSTVQDPRVTQAVGEVSERAIRSTLDSMDDDDDGRQEGKGSQEKDIVGDGGDDGTAPPGSSKPDFDLARDVSASTGALLQAADDALDETSTWKASSPAVARATAAAAAGGGGGGGRSKPGPPLMALATERLAQVLVGVLEHERVEETGVKLISRVLEHDRVQQASANAMSGVTGKTVTSLWEGVRDGVSKAMTVPSKPSPRR